MPAKGQLISKTDWLAIDSPKKQTDEFVLFAILLFTANKSNLSIHFLGESTACQSAFWFLTNRVTPFFEVQSSKITVWIPGKNSVSELNYSIC